jgi:hypothetical protein
MSTLRGIAQPSGYPLTRTLLAYWRKLLTATHFQGFGVARQGPWNTVEKVGVELIATTNRARTAPKSAYLVSNLG